MLFLILGLDVILDIMKVDYTNVEQYNAPEVTVFDIETEGVLCGSGLKPGESEDGELGDDL